MGLFSKKPSRLPDSFFSEPFDELSYNFGKLANSKLARDSAKYVAKQNAKPAKSAKAKAARSKGKK